MHAWVLVLAGKRMLEASLFLEPSTGAAYAVEEAPYYGIPNPNPNPNPTPTPTPTPNQAPYYGIEAVWSSSNLWVNMQQDKVPSAMAYDLQSLTRWEHVMSDSMATPLDELEAEVRVRVRVRARVRVRVS